MRHSLRIIVALAFALGRVLGRAVGAFFMGETIYPWPRDRY